MNATVTRDRILESMFLDIRKNGFQGLRVDKVIADMDITKGAVYHYFPNKTAIGAAVIEEIIRPNYLAFYRELDQFEGNPVPKLLGHLRFLCERATDEEVSLGCPLNNLMQEMSPIDEDFRQRLNGVVGRINASVAAALVRGKSAGFIRPEVDAESMGRFFFAAIEGSYSIAKVSKSASAFVKNMEILGNYLRSLQTDNQN